MSEQPSRTGERVFLVVVDESPEMRKALRYACRRAKRTGGRVALLYVMDPPEGQQWGGVVDLISISVLVLGSASSSEGPGPLVTAFSGKLGSQLRIPLTIVPGVLTEAEIDAIS